MGYRWMSPEAQEAAKKSHCSDDSEGFVVSKVDVEMFVVVSSRSSRIEGTWLMPRQGQGF